MSETKIKYITTRWRDSEIQRLEITRETEKCIFYFRMGFNGGREKKETRMLKDEHVHETYAAARALLITRAEKNLEYKHTEVSQAERQLAKVRAIPEIEPEAS